MVQRGIFPRKITRDELNSLIDKAADLIRTAVDYKFILVLLFLKRLNDLGKSERLQVKERLMKETGLSEKEAEDEADKFDYTFKIPKQFLWDEITKDVKNLPERLATAISEIAKLNKELQGVINRIDFLEFARNQENRELLRQLVELFNKYELNGEISPNILGDAYEHILMKFAPQKAKEGEIYTPREVIKLMVEILDPKPGESVYDPCCGSGGMLIISYMHVAEKYGKEETGKLFLYGQERSPEIYAVGQMDLLLHGIQNANLANGDTLDYPRFRDNGKLRQFDIVIANPPWNQDGYNGERLKRAEFRERFSLGSTPQSSADWAWIQHMLASASDKEGKIGIVIDNGCLFRGGEEKAIRSRTIEKDLVECIILLPEKLFYNTGAPGAIIILNKNKPIERRKKVLFINASNEFVTHPSVRRLNTFSAGNIKSIADAYRKFAETSGFSRVVEMKEIMENNCNLNVSLYVMPVDREEKVSISRVYLELKKLEKERQDAKEKLEDVLKQIMEIEKNGSDSLS
jgi:type I restriction enzyme M protein